MTDETTTKKKRGRPAKPKAPTMIDMPALEGEITPLRETAEMHLQRLSSVGPLTNQGQIDMFGKLLIDVRERKDALEARRKTITGPLNEAKRAVDALFKPPRDLLVAMEKLISERLGLKMQEAAEGVEKALQSGDHAGVGAATALLPEGLNEGADTYEIEVVDLSLVPRQFMCLDEKLIKAYAKHNNGNVTIPGLVVKVIKNFRRAAGQ